MVTCTLYSRGPIHHCTKCRHQTFPLKSKTTWRWMILRSAKIFALWLSFLFLHSNGFQLEKLQNDFFIADNFRQLPWYSVSQAGRSWSHWKHAWQQYVAALTLLLTLWLNSQAGIPACRNCLSFQKLPVIPVQQNKLTTVAKSSQ